MRRRIARDGLLLVGSTVLLALVRVAVMVVSFRAMLRVVDQLSVVPAGTRHSPSAAEVERVQWVVLKASRYVPGGRHCLTRALAAKILFGRKGRAADLRIGVAKDNAGHLIAHAWLESADVPIFGATDSERGQYSLLPQLYRA